jgi:hypothetical protein
LLDAGSFRDIHPGSADHLQFVRLPEKIVKSNSFCDVETSVCEWWIEGKRYSVLAGKLLVMGCLPRNNVCFTQFLKFIRPTSELIWRRSDCAPFLRKPSYQFRIVTAIVVLSRFRQNFVPRFPPCPIPIAAFPVVYGLTMRRYADGRISRARSASSLYNRRDAHGHVDIEIGRYRKTTPMRGVDGPASDRLAQGFILGPVHGRSLPVNYLATVIDQQPHVDDSFRRSGLCAGVLLWGGDVTQKLLFCLQSRQG